MFFDAFICSLVFVFHFLFFLQYLFHDFYSDIGIALVFRHLKACTIQMVASPPLSGSVSSRSLLKCSSFLFWQWVVGRRQSVWPLRQWQRLVLLQALKWLVARDPDRDVAAIQGFTAPTGMDKLCEVNKEELLALED